MHLVGAISNGNDTNPETSDVFYNPPMDSYTNIVYYRRETLQFDTSDTRTITFPAYAATQWVVIVARIVGEAKIVTVGVNADGSTAIEGDTAGYGTSDHPGIVAMTTTKVTSFTLTGLADSTTVEYLACIAVADDDTALIT